MDQRDRYDVCFITASRRERSIPIYMKKRLYILSAALVTLFTAQTARADTLDFQGAVDKLNTENQLVVTQNFADSKGQTGKMVVMVEPAYTQAATLAVKETPDADAKTIRTLVFGQKVSRVGLCDNGWSKVLVKNNTGDKVYGYTESYYLSDSELLTEMEEELTVIKDAEVLDFPGTRNGLSIGSVVEAEKVMCTGVSSNEWSRIRTENNKGEEITGFVPNSVLSETKASSASNATNASGDDDLIEGEAVLKPGDSESLWAKASKEVSQELSTTTTAGVLEGEAVPVSADAKLTPLGTFRITHYCPCSICCGPWANGITSTGVTARTNHTIAVNPSQIPYGSKVVINGQVYVAEDCGGAIVDNCIDVYVATHEEGESKGVFYTDVYLLEE